MEKEINVGKRCKLIVRQLNGSISIWTGLLLEETDLNYTIQTDRGEKRTEAKLFTSVEWL